MSVADDPGRGSRVEVEDGVGSLVVVSAEEPEMVILGLGWTG